MIAAPEKHRCICGRHALAFPSRFGRKSSRSARTGKPTCLPGHDLCQKCYVALLNKMRLLPTSATMGRNVCKFHKGETDNGQEENVQPASNC